MKLPEETRLIKTSEIEPGDYLLVTAPREFMEDTLRGCERVFKGLKVIIVGVPDDTTVEVIKK